MAWAVQYYYHQIIDVLADAIELFRVGLQRTVEIANSPEGIVVVLRDRITALIGDAGSLGQKFVSLATVLARGPFDGPIEIDLRVAASPLLIRNPLGPIVSGNAGG